MKYSFMNDYDSIGSTKVLEKLISLSNEQNVGYGQDIHTKNAQKMILELIGDDSFNVFFGIGGTSANLLVIDHLLLPYEAVICADTGHINVHETGAIENTGHKVLTVKNKNGKVNIDDIKKILFSHSDYHMVKPKLIYISMSTEVGTIYSKEELLNLSNFAHDNGLLLFLDGARLASALTSRDNDIKITDLARLVDAFTIGGTKNGLLFGEAIIIKKELSQDFLYQLKQKGGMLAKGYITAIMFETVLEDNTYFEYGKMANEMAYYLADELEKLGIELNEKAMTNQIFVRMKEALYHKINADYPCEIFNHLGDDVVVRFVTTYKTTKEHIDSLIMELKKII